MEMLPESEPVWVLIEVEGVRRGFRTNRAFRDFLRRMGIPYRRIGKRTFVDPREIDRAIERLPIARTAPTEDAIKQQIAASIRELPKRRRQ